MRRRRFLALLGLGGSALAVNAAPARSQPDHATPAAARPLRTESAARPYHGPLPVAGSGLHLPF